MYVCLRVYECMHGYKYTCMYVCKAASLRIRSTCGIYARMFVCMYVCMHVCTPVYEFHISMDACTHVYMSVCKYVSACARARTQIVCMLLGMFACIRASIYKFMHACAHVCMCMYAGMYVCMYVCIYICMYLHMYVSVHVSMYVRKTKEYPWCYMTVFACRCVSKLQRNVRSA